MNNKKTILHFTLAVGLIVGICVTAKLRPSTAAASNYLSNLSQDIEIKDGLKSVKNNTITNEIGINDTLDSSNIKESAKNESEISYKKGKNTDTNTTYPEKTIADIRINFDVSSSEAVKELQKILGLEEDGIFGPKTSAAYQAALSEDTPKNKEESSASITNAMLD
ncbi:MAG: hypothetical protein CMG13_07025 [Candidatus Marinimicrobia bacterium]|nr:hypothetical protein [Candidatus Neomarinimicrobiota bacterium]|tara:strand:- start:3686 stop:4183 length:498 start_codon:yes stop_codon:yes gene_type:complete